jgi:glycosyltransferase involved in cell wall biosynthesis
MKTFSFVIPTYNHYNLLHQILYDIYQKCSPSLYLIKEVIVVDDCSTDEDYISGLSWWKKNGMLPIRHIRMSENSMFLKASNAGLKKAEGDIVCLISNDVRIVRNIVQEIILLMEEKERRLVGGRFLDWDTGWNSFGKNIFPYLEGWLLAAYRDGWKKLEYFDERFAPSDMEDIDISTKALSMGYDLVALHEIMTKHLGGQSIGFNPEREKITIANKEKFRQKWMK